MKIPTRVDPCISRAENPGKRQKQSHVTSFRPVPWLPIRASWRARITKFAWDSHFCDEQIRGPFAVFRHCHWTREEIQSGVCGTLVTDHIIYALPFGAVGRIGSGMVRSKLEQTFAERQQRLVRLITNN